MAHWRYEVKEREKISLLCRIDLVRSGVQLWQWYPPQVRWPTLSSSSQIQSSKLQESSVSSSTEIEEAYPSVP